MAAPGDVPEDVAGLKESATRLISETGWCPTAIHHAAGALPFYGPYGDIKDVEGCETQFRAAFLLGYSTRKLPL